MVRQKIAMMSGRVSSPDRWGKDFLFGCIRAAQKSVAQWTLGLHLIYANMVGRDFGEVFLEAFPPGTASFGFADCAFLLRRFSGLLRAVVRGRLVWIPCFVFGGLDLVAPFITLVVCVFNVLCTVCRQCFSPPSFAPVKLCPQHCLHTDLLV
jgi:hypothetical protein